MNLFERKLAENAVQLKRDRLTILQVNVGKRCNQACRHCHVDAAPWRTESMNEATARKVGAWIQKYQPDVVDITGGAPEINPHFRYLVETARATDCHVIDRNNLTIIEEEGFGDLPEYLARNQVEVIASLPCYSSENVNRQRGQGVFDKSISALKKLNAVGYGESLDLHLVYNPVGPSLPGSQEELEADYKEALEESFGVRFNRLYTITNQPIARFAEDLRRQQKLEEYMELLVNNFNSSTVPGLMCRDTLSVDYLGFLYDCDFNQMLAMGMTNGRHLKLWDIEPDDLVGRPIKTGSHCFACTAGAGSSCGGALGQE